MIQYMKSCNAISRIFGVAHNPVVRAVNNEYSPPDNTSSDYEEAGGEFLELFPPREAGAEEAAQQQLPTNVRVESEADAPEADAPEADAPEADSPEADASEADAPEADASEADASEADDEVETVAQVVIVKSDVADHEGANIASQQLQPLRGSNKATPILISDDDETVIQRPLATKHEVLLKSASADATQRGSSERPIKAETKVDVIQPKEQTTIKEECDDGAVTQFLQSIPDYDFSQLHATFMEKGVKSRKQLKTLAEDFNDDERLAALKDMLKNVSHFDRILLSKGLRSFNSS